ncbi:scamp family-domain-containing protein [Lanmaoa asiatica]|nr:scamp family-domain-containing protein [Lanmaoa asiatica]
MTFLFYMHHGRAAETKGWLCITISVVTPATSDHPQTTTPINGYVLLLSPPLQLIPSPADYTQNPFASTHSLDANPFDDPNPKQNARVQDLNSRERDLERREQELNQRAEYIRKHGRNNWPPFFPLIYHSISEEIPDASRPLITRLYHLWLVLLATLLINMVACIFILIAGASDGGKDLGGSIGYAFLFPLVLLLWWISPPFQYLHVSPSSYLPSASLVPSLYRIIGIPSTGSAGLIQTIQMFSRGHWAAGILGAIATLGWSVQGLGNAFYYRQAKAELASHGAKAYFTRG